MATRVGIVAGDARTELGLHGLRVHIVDISQAVSLQFGEDLGEVGRLRVYPQHTRGHLVDDQKAPVPEILASSTASSIVRTAASTWIDSA